jgi:cell wall-associated NlpC family hydrolase
MSSPQKVTGEDVAREAENLIGSRWKANGRGPGIDCVGLVVLAARNAGLRIKDDLRYDIKSPPRDMMINLCSNHGEVCGKDAREPGMIFLVKPPGFPGVSHMGIISGYNRAIHMDISKRSVVVDDFNWLDANCVLTIRFDGLTD